MAQFRHIVDKPPPHPLPILFNGGKAMRNIMAGFAILGFLASGTVAPAVAGPLAVAPVGQSHDIRQADWDGDGCGPRCREYRRGAREREWEHRRWEQHRRWEESRYGYQYRY